MKLDIWKLLAQHPNMHIHFHDRGAWMLFHDRAARDAFNEVSHRDGLIVEGDECDVDGYLPDIVKALADAVGITADST